MNPTHHSMSALCIAAFCISCGMFLSTAARGDDTAPEETAPPRVAEQGTDGEETAGESSDENPPWAEEPVPEPESTTYLPPPPPPPEDEAEAAQEDAPKSSTDMCHAVSCSGQGACVIQHGSPTCACFPGYLPDRVNGLSCVSEARIHAPSPPPAPDTVPSETRFTEADYRKLQQALRPEDLSADLDKYRAERDTGKFKGTFPDYLRKSFKRTQNLATVSLAFGIAALAGGLSCHMLYAGFSDRNGFLAGAVILDIVGVGLISTGAVFTAQTTRLTRKLDLFEKNRQRRSARLTLHLPRPLVARAGAGIQFGLSFI